MANNFKDTMTFGDAIRLAGPMQFNIMIKPAGSLCNLDCHYCYYLDKAEIYGGNEPKMTYEMLEKCVKEYIDANDVQEVTFNWHGGEPLVLGLDFYRKAVELQQKYCGDKPVVITEFGLCEPAHKGGDTRRIEIYREKLAYYQKYDLAGWVYFCLNDYRTHIGETGEGRFKQRIHGSVDLCGAKKPSYAFIQAQNLAAQNDDKG